MGPVPLRTARGAGRDDFDFVVLPLLVERVLRDWLPDDRVFEEAEREDALLFDDAGGEDVRVAMVSRVGERHTSPTLHTPGD